MEDNRRDELIRVAAHLFRQKGYAQTTVRDLANEVGIKSGSIFYHFSSKSEILLAVMQKALSTKRMYIEQVISSNNPPLKNLRDAIKAELEVLHSDSGESMTVLAYEWNNLDDENKEKIIKMRDEYEMLWIKLLDECNKIGAIVGDSFIMRRLLVGAMSWTINWYKPSGRINLDQLAEHVFRMALKPEVMM